MVTARSNLYGYLPDTGAEARLYDKDAKCRNYRDATAYVSFIGEKSYRSIYHDKSDQDGIIVINDIPEGEYYLALTTLSYIRYSEKILTIPAKDTLELVKNFTNDGDYIELSEPWDHTIPGDQFSPDDPL